ncbi:hypothetical protein [Amycolatopsis sp. NPDC051061]|uniref:hypothetical protein n=1 Tax=Amycolatopsis sp. NPDC051061 TaxID=3155042 RepID=UPI003423A1CA
MGPPAGTRRHFPRRVGGRSPRTDRLGPFGRRFRAVHLIVGRGRLAGLWEFDVDAEKIVHQFFGEEDEALREAVAATEEFVRDDLGDARSFSLDSPKSRAPRLAALKA